MTNRPERERRFRDALEQIATGHATGGSVHDDLSICPACKNRTVFVGSGGFLTCSLIGCPDPLAPSKAMGVTFEGDS